MLEEEKTLIGSNSSKNLRIYCFSSDFTSNIYKLETEEILNRFVCEIFKIEFEINSTKKTCKYTSAVSY